MTELMLSHAMDVPGEDIMFSSNDTPAEEFAYAAKIGATINLDDITHIDFLEKTIGYLPKTLSCRYNPRRIFLHCQQHYGQPRRCQIRLYYGADV